MRLIELVFFFFTENLNTLMKNMVIFVVESSA